MLNESLADVYRDCHANFTALWPDLDRRLVFGDGQAYRPRLMLVGEAPGEQETLQGKPFVGKAGKNLTAFLTAIGLTRDVLYTGNVVKFRPSRISAANRLVNRAPTREEIALFVPWLLREVAAVRPQALVTLGNVALGAFVGRGAVIGNHHGRWQTVTLRPPGQPDFALPLFALYHPASVLYNRALTAVYQADLQTLKASLPENGVYTDT